MKKKNLLLAGSLMAGVLLAGCSGQSDEKSADPKPAPTVTVTATETATETAEPAPTVTETAEAVTKTQVPDACLEAISTAEDIAKVIGQFASATAKYPPLVGQAFEAGVAQDVPTAKAILSKMKNINRQFTDQNDRMEPLVSQFNSAKTACRAAAD